MAEFATVGLPRLVDIIKRSAEEWAAAEQRPALSLARLRLSLCGALEWSGVAATLGTDAMRAVAGELEAHVQACKRASLATHYVPRITTRQVAGSTSFA